jgi:hypothetical protein
LECDSENELEDCAVLDVLVDGDSDQDNDIQDFVWEDINNYKGKGKISAAVFDQSAAKQVTDIVDVFKLFFIGEFVAKIVEETYRYAEQFLQGRKSSSKSPARAWKPVTEEEIYVVVGLFMLMGIIQKPTLRSYFTTKRVISTPSCYNKRQT